VTTGYAFQAQNAQNMFARPHW